MNFMKKMLRFFNRHKNLIFIFVFSFLVYEFIAYPINNGDSLAMYGFGHAIKMGEIPYRDFNIISTPLYAFYISIGLHLFDNYLMYIIEQCILVTILFYFLFKILDKKAWFVLLIMTFFDYIGFLGTYNFLCFLFIIILVYFEKNKPEWDYLIGFIIGLAILSKHTVGLLLLIPLLVICFNNKKKLFKRIIGITIPCLIFLIYLIFNNALFDFINLSFLGLFDFGAENSNVTSIFFYLAMLLVSIMTIIIFKNRKDKYNYYFLCTFAFCIPLFDYNHVFLFFNYFIIFILQYIMIKNIDYFSKLAIFIIFLYSGLHFVWFNQIDARFYNKLEHFNYMYNFTSDYKYNLKINKFLDKYENKNTIMLSEYTMFYDISRDRKINYYDVLFYGNHGYKGTERMIKEISNLKNTYIIVDIGRYNMAAEESQFNKKIVKYVLDNYEKVDAKYNFWVYYKK